MGLVKAQMRGKGGAVPPAEFLGLLDQAELQRPWPDLPERWEGGLEAILREN